MEELGGGTPAREAGSAAREVDLSLLLDSVQEAFARIALDGTIEFVSARRANRLRARARAS